MENLKRKHQDAEDAGKPGSPRCHLKDVDEEVGQIRSEVS